MTTVEMAVVAPIFIMLVFSMIEFGRAVMMKQTVTDAARAGCRKAILATTNSADHATTAAREHLNMATPASGLYTVSVSPNDFSSMEQGTEITTTVSVSYSDVSWLVPSFLGDVTLEGESTMLRE